VKGKLDADQSMLETRIEENTGIQEDVQELHGMANAGLCEPSLPGFFESGTGGNPCEHTPTSDVGRINVTYVRTPSARARRRGRILRPRHKACWEGDERGAYTMLVDVREIRNVESPTGREPYGEGALTVVDGVTTIQGDGNAVHRAIGGRETIEWGWFTYA
jgi:hypothetical protein